MAQMKISNTLVNDTSTGEIAYAEQLKDRLLKTYINSLATKDKNRIPSDIKAEAGVFQERLNEFFIKHWVDFQAFLLDEGVDPAVIDSWAEVQEFLEGLPDDEAMWLKTKLQQLDNRITAMDIPDGGAYDVSADHVDGGGVYADYPSLSGAIADIAKEDRKSGMYIRYIDSTTGKYKFYHYKLEYADTTEGNADFATESNWASENLDEYPTEGSRNLVMSGAIYDSYAHQVYLGEDSQVPAPASFDPEADTVHLNAQVLSEAQKTQVRANLGFGNGNIDNEPIEDSQNLVESGGVYKRFEDAEGIRKKILVSSGNRIYADLFVTPGTYYVAVLSNTEYEKLNIYDITNVTSENPDPVKLEPELLQDNVFVELNITSNIQKISFVSSKVFTEDTEVELLVCKKDSLEGEILNLKLNLRNETQETFEDIGKLLSKSGYVYHNTVTDIVSVTEDPSSNYFISDYIPWDEESEIKYSGLFTSQSFLVISCFDKDRHFLGGIHGIYNYQSGTYTPPESTKYVIFSTLKERISKVQFIFINSLLGITKKGFSELNELSGNLSNLEKVVDSLSYLSPVYGVIFGSTQGDIDFREALEGAWLQILDSSVEIPEKLYLNRLSNKEMSEGSGYSCILDFTDDSTTISTDDDYQDHRYFSFSDQFQQSGIVELTLAQRINFYPGDDPEDPNTPSRPTGSILHLKLNWDKLKNTRYILGECETYIDTALINKSAPGQKSNSLPLEGKTLVCFGDSITEFRGTIDQRTYPECLAAITGANVINLGVGATRLRQRANPVINPAAGYQDTNYAALDIVNMVRAACDIMYDENTSYLQLAQTAAEYIRVNKPSHDDNTQQISRLANINLSKVDGVIILGGTNDWNNGDETKWNWNDIDSYNEQTSCGAINIIIQTLLTAYPHISLYWATPIIRWYQDNTDPNHHTDTDNYSDKKAFDGVTLRQFSNSLKQVTENKHIPTIDLYNTLGWNEFNFSQYFQDDDGTHPYKGFYELAEKIGSFIVANNTL